MSFFYDLLNYFKVDDFSSKTSISIIVGVGLMIVGNIKILNLSDEDLKFQSGKDIIEIVGENLKLRSVSKGEIIIEGKIKNLNMVNKNGK